jgi:hypothetical protein
MEKPRLKTKQVKLPELTVQEHEILKEILCWISVKMESCGENTIAECLFVFLNEIGEDKGFQELLRKVNFKAE